MPGAGSGHALVVKGQYNRGSPPRASLLPRKRGGGRSLRFNANDRGERFLLFVKSRHRDFFVDRVTFAIRAVSWAMGRKENNNTDFWD
jgi:hypothetical protein